MKNPFLKNVNSATSPKHKSNQPSGNKELDDTNQFYVGDESYVAH